MEMGELTAFNEEAILCALVLKGVDIHKARQLSSSICSHKEEAGGVTPQWWLHSAIRSIFQVMWTHTLYENALMSYIFRITLHHQHPVMATLQASLISMFGVFVSDVLCR